MMGASIIPFLCIAVLLVLQVSAVRNHPGRRRHSRSPDVLYNGYDSIHKNLLPGVGCTVPLPPEIKAPHENVWAGLTALDEHDITKWLKQQEELNLTGKHSYEIDSIQLLAPNKSDVLQYIDHNGQRPGKYASVRLLEASSDTPEYFHVSVGPLPISNATGWQTLTNIFTSSGGRTRALYGAHNAKWHEYNQFMNNITNGAKDITNGLWNLTAKEYTYDTGQDPSWQYDDKITEWYQYWAWGTEGGDSMELLPLGLFFKVSFDLYLSEPSTWKFGGWVYNEVLYETTEEFRKAYSSPDFERLPPNTDGPWTTTGQKGPALPLDTEAPPMPVAKTARFKVDYDQNYIEWMGFSFYLSFLVETGMSLFDLQFKGERILYELGIQEALAHYAGNSPEDSGTAYLDSAYSLGSLNELMPGFDCPTYATYLNVTLVGSYDVMQKNAVCLFEYDADYPIQRHSYVTNTKNIYFVVRTITTVGNYDYMFSYEFYMDGSIQVSVRAAGYIHSAYYAKNEDYGYQIHDALSGAMHDHVLNFKADFDILGTANTMELVTVEATTQNYVWSDQPRRTMKLSRTQVESEDDSQLMWAGNGATQYRIVNTDKKNKFGEYRGYRILPSQGTIHLAATNSSNLVNAANWAYHDLAVTKRKDTEPRSASPRNGENVYEPLVDFQRFFDGESLQQEDLVVWFNLGMHHIPHTGDLPNTVFTTAHSAIQITPSNYFDRDQSRDTVNMIELDYKGGSPFVRTFGQAQQVCVADTPHGYS